jgi:hypothetical protein
MLLQGEAPADVQRLPVISPATVCFSSQGDYLPESLPIAQSNVLAPEPWDKDGQVYMSLVPETQRPLRAGVAR